MSVLSPISSRLRTPLVVASLFATLSASGAAHVRSTGDLTGAIGSNYRALASWPSPAPRCSARAPQSGFGKHGAQVYGKAIWENITADDSADLAHRHRED